MLITTCTHCLARFRVTPQQLNLKQGQVRCGRCGKVFSGFEALERFPDDDTGARLLAAREAEQPSASPNVPSTRPVEELPEIEEIDLGPPSQPLPVPPAPAPKPEGPISSPLAAPRPEGRTSAPLPAPRPEGPTSAPLPGAKKAARPSPTPPFAPPPRKRPSRLWTVGVVLLLVVLAGEALYAFRGTVAQSYPALRPWLEAACARAGCRIPWSREDRLLKLEDSELLEVPGRPGEISLSARIRNLAAVPQEYPHLELTLTDNAGQPAARRVLRPADYLGRVPAPNEALPAGADIALQLRIDTGRLRATGYELLLFYP